MGPLKGLWNMKKGMKRMKIRYLSRNLGFFEVGRR